MLDAMTPAQMNEWMAAYKVDPWGIEPADLRELHATIHNGSLRVECAVFATAGADVGQVEFATGDDFKPGTAKTGTAKTKATSRMTAEQSEQWAARRYGG